MEVRVGVLAYLFDKWMAPSIDGVGPTTCALLFVKVLCHAVHHAHRQIRMTGLDIETVSLLHRLKQLVEREHFVDDSHFDGVGTNNWSCGGQRRRRIVAAAIVGLLLSCDLALAKNLSHEL